MITDLPERFIVAEMIREQLLRQVHDEIPFGTAVVVENFTEKPQQQLVVIQATIFVAREAHKKIVLGHGGSKIKAIGQAARHSIQRLLGDPGFSRTAGQGGEELDRGGTLPETVRL
jgi:GTPase